jgi:hypothetical protein
VWKAKEAESNRVKYWGIVADTLSKAGWSLGCVSTVDFCGEQSSLLMHIATAVGTNDKPLFVVAMRVH